MKVLLIFLVMVLLDRAIPIQMRAFGGEFFKTSDKEFYKKYGLFAFPRTFFAFCVVAAASLDLFFIINEILYVFIIVPLLVIYCASAAFDAFKARK